MSDRLSGQDPIEVLTATVPGLGQAFTAFFAASLQPAKIDIVTRELVRIYSGRQSHCNYCQSVRARAALDRGLDDDMVAQLDDFEHSTLSARHKSAIRFAHAFLVDPTSFGPDARADLLTHFRPDQVAELVLELIRLRPGSKLTIASGTDIDAVELVVL
jgi:AhpD family alkylhydroperoxidase